MEDEAKFVAGCAMVLVSVVFSFVGMYFLYLAATIGLGLEVRSWSAFIGYYFLYALCSAFASAFVKTINKL